MDDSAPMSVVALTVGGTRGAAAREPLGRPTEEDPVTTEHARPTWQADACPDWCVVLHAQDDDERDRTHVSASLSVPARQLLGGPGAEVSPFAEREPSGPPGSPEAMDSTAAADLAVCLHRRDGAPSTWVYVGDGAVQHLELSTDSWRRILPALDRVLELAGG